MGDVRDFQAEREAAIKEAIKQQEADENGVDTSHLKSLLKAKAPVAARVDVPQPMPPGTAVPGQPLSPLPVGQPEPNDGSAPDKRKQDNSPKRDKATGVVIGPKDPGPEFKVSGPLPDAVAEPVRPSKLPKSGSLPDQVPPDPVDEDELRQTPEELQRVAKAKDRYRDKVEAEGPSTKVDANEAAPVLPDEVKENPPKPETTPKVKDTKGVSKSVEQDEKDAAKKGTSGRSAAASRRR
jgi:hypothetical protein